MTTRRALQWVTQTRTGTIAGAMQNVDRLDTEGAFVRKGTTLTRLIGVMSLVPAAVNVLQKVSYGVIMVNEDAFNAAAVPDPEVPDNADWLCWESRFFRQTEIKEVHIPCDLRGQRKYRSEDSVIALITHVDTGSVEYLFNYRLLLKLG